MPKTVKRYEILWVDSGRTEILTEEEAIEKFGRDEWPEYRENYLPHVAVMEL